MKNETMSVWRLQTFVGIITANPLALCGNGVAVGTFTA